MRYLYSSWTDVDRTLEAFRYARRSLLVVMALALPFAAWDAATAPTSAVRDDTTTVRAATYLLPIPYVQPTSVCDREPAVARIEDASV